MNCSLLVLCSLVVVALSRGINNQSRQISSRDTGSFSPKTDVASHLQRRQNTPVGSVEQAATGPPNKSLDTRPAAPSRRSVQVENLQKRQAIQLMQLIMELRRFFNTLKDNTEKVQTALGTTGPVPEAAKAEARKMFESLRTSMTALEASVSKMGASTGMSTQEVSAFFKTTTDNAEKTKKAVIASTKNPNSVRAFIDQLMKCLTTVQTAISRANPTEIKTALLAFMNNINPAMAKLQAEVQ